MVYSISGLQLWSFLLISLTLSLATPASTLEHYNDVALLSLYPKQEYCTLKRQGPCDELPSKSLALAPEECLSGDYPLFYGLKVNSGATCLDGTPAVLTIYNKRRCWGAWTLVEMTGDWRKEVWPIAGDEWSLMFRCDFNPSDSGHTREAIRTRGPSTHVNADPPEIESAKVSPRTTYGTFINYAEAPERIGFNHNGFQCPIGPHRASTYPPATFDTCYIIPGKGLQILTPVTCANGTRAQLARFKDFWCQKPSVQGLRDVSSDRVNPGCFPLAEDEEKVSSIAFHCEGVRHDQKLFSMEEIKFPSDSFDKRGVPHPGIIAVFNSGSNNVFAGSFSGRVPAGWDGYQEPGVDTCFDNDASVLQILSPPRCKDGEVAPLARYSEKGCWNNPFSISYFEAFLRGSEVSLQNTRSFKFICHVSPPREISFATTFSAFDAQRISNQDLECGRDGCEDRLPQRHSAIIATFEQSAPAPGFQQIQQGQCISFNPYTYDIDILLPGLTCPDSTKARLLKYAVPNCYGLPHEIEEYHTSQQNRVRRFYDATFTNSISVTCEPPGKIPMSMAIGSSITLDSKDGYKDYCPDVFPVDTCVEFPKKGGYLRINNLASCRYGTRPYEIRDCRDRNATLEQWFSGTEAYEPRTYDMENTKSIAFLCAASPDEKVLKFPTAFPRIRERAEWCQASFPMERPAPVAAGAAVDHGPVEFFCGTWKIDQQNYDKLSSWNKFMLNRPILGVLTTILYNLLLFCLILSVLWICSSTRLKEKTRNLFRSNHGPIAL